MHAGEQPIISTGCETMPIIRQTPNRAKFNREATLPYQLRPEDFGLVMQDVYDFFFDVNTHLAGKGIKRLGDVWPAWW